MIKSVTVTNPTGESLELELTRPELSGLIVRSIDGMGPVKRNINVTEYSVIDGGVYNSGRFPYRNITLQLRFLPKPTIEDTRLLTYAYFPVKQLITLLFKTDNREATITGYVESNKPDIFSKEEGCQISIICPDPYFYAPDSISYSFSSVQPSFEFPVSWELDGEIQEKKEFSYVLNESVGNVPYDGATDTGIVVYIHAINDVSGDLMVMNVYTGEYMTILEDKLTALTGHGILSGDSIYISTVDGNKYVQLMRGGRVINILNAFDRSSTWLQLRKGDNFFKFFFDGEPEDLQFYVLGNVRYEGL